MRSRPHAARRAGPHTLSTGGTLRPLAFAHRVGFHRKRAGPRAGGGPWGRPWGVSLAVSPL